MYGVWCIEWAVGTGKTSWDAGFTEPKEMARFRDCGEKVPRGQLECKRCLEMMEVYVPRYCSFGRHFQSRSTLILMGIV